VEIAVCPLRGFAARTTWGQLQDAIRSPRRHFRSMMIGLSDILFGIGIAKDRKWRNVCCQEIRRWYRRDRHSLVSSSLVRVYVPLIRPILSSIAFSLYALDVMLSAHNAAWYLEASPSLPASLRWALSRFRARDQIPEHLGDR